MSVVRVRVVVSGVVQGVWFRHGCRREARRLGVAGWVRNLADGRVELEAEGDRDRVEALVGWAHDGPPHAAVDRVEIDDLTPVGETDFRVR